MTIRIATLNDIPEIQRIRRSVLENILTSTVTDEDVAEVMEQTGRIWVDEGEGIMTGFSAADKTASNIWALFLLPEYEGKGIGKELLHEAIQWLWSQDVEKIWLSTGQNTRAEKFYRLQGWKDCGIESNGEVRFELVRS